MAERVITADDVVRAGACVDGVSAAVKRLHKHIAAAMPVSAILRLLADDEVEYVMKAAVLDGNGYGYGYGYGDGDGEY